ncbi:hypothetical protein Dsin_031286 [Dipteronia sinensis]|uniref:Pentatricopeptide repeat-containing protein n=1 Tax=Dipteronia sinensis TaxID=43782 RepID=A0AAD9ZL83_9ROSI|nr:hypothetical protein Dsin_031286 [Dipteronia sinensis]
MSSKDVVTWNAIITGYWQNGFLQESKNLFESMLVKNIVSWNCMIAGCIDHEKMVFIYQLMTTQLTNATSFSILGRRGFSLLSSHTKRNTASYNALISGFVKYGRGCLQTL